MRKRFYYIGVLLLATVCVLTLYGGISRAGVRGTKHDMSASYNPDGGGGANLTFETYQVCVFCHTPHGTNTNARTYTYITTGDGQSYNVSGNPILGWNRGFANGIPAAGVGYNVYTSSTLNANVGRVRIYSLMCMGCHDGISAVNAMVNPPDIGDNADESYDSNGYPTPEQLETTLRGTPASIGERTSVSDDVNLTNDHPISFNYDNALYVAEGGASGGLRQPSTGYVSDGGVSLRLFPNESGQWVSMECSTCHDPHNYGSVAANTEPFLAATVTDSRLCRVCHLK